MKTVTCNLIRKNKKNNNTKTVTINVEGISQGQWSTFFTRAQLNEKSMATLWCRCNIKSTLNKKNYRKGYN